MLTMRKELRVYLRASGEIAKRFSRIKEYLGLKNDTEVLRYVINEFWREELKKEEGKEAIELQCRKG